MKAVSLSGKVSDDGKTFVDKDNKSWTVTNPEALKGHEGHEVILTAHVDAAKKKIANHAAAVAIWFMYYNFCRVHSTLRVTPAMESGISDHVWSLEEMCTLLPTQGSATKRIDRDLILKALV